MTKGERREKIVNEALRKMRMSGDSRAQLAIVELYRTQYGRRVAEQIEKAARVRAVR